MSLDLRQKQVLVGSGLTVISKEITALLENTKGTELYNKVVSLRTEVAQMQKVNNETAISNNYQYPKG